MKKMRRREWCSWILESPLLNGTGKRKGWRRMKGNGVSAANLLKMNRNEWERVVGMSLKMKMGRND